MKCFIVGVVALCCVTTCLYAQAGQGPTQKLTLRVTSSSQKPISFNASLFFKTDKPRLDFTMQQTPYEVTATTDYVNATFIKTSGDGNLVVDLVKANKVGDQPDLKASSSTIVVVGTRDAAKGLYYQQTF
jgi:hypothetical protein